MENEAYVQDALRLLEQLIATPSVSREETKAADVMEQALRDYGLEPCREGNNLWTTAPGYDASRPTLLLNAHVDTVKPVVTWTRDPFRPEVIDGRLYGLGANDCGGGLVSLLQAFRLLSAKPQPYNLIYLVSAEEEVSGANGISRVLPLLPPVDVAIVGEPTSMQPAIAEKGLMVIDGVAHGVSGHAARREGVNAIDIALDDIAWLRRHTFPNASPLLGATQATVTIIHAGTQHNVIPDRCEFTIDARTNEFYRNEELFEYLQQHMKSELHARSYRLQSSRIDPSHPLVRRCVSMGMTPFGSPTLSDQALMSWPSLKLGPGESARSHSADEFICIEEIEQAVQVYMTLLDQLKL